LTLANPNFSSAFLAMQSVIPLIYFFQTRGKLRFLHLTVYLVTLVMIYLTKSYQGAVMVFISVIVGILVVLYLNRNLKYFWSVLIGMFLSFLLVISTILLKISPIYEKFLQIEPSMGILARLSHWQTGINIWSNYPIFGVGIENLGRYSGAYIPKDFSNSLGGMVTPDKSHNTLIDHFANGGFVAGTAWFAFAIYISVLAVKIHAQKLAVDSHWIKIGLSSIWFMHLFQSFISTDHIYNVLIAYLSAGAIISIYNENKNKL
jgi:O-antigen ligase